MILLNSLNSVTKIVVITVKGLNLPPVVLEARMVPRCQEDTC